MGIFQEIVSLFPVSRDNVPLTEEEKTFRWQQLQEDPGQIIYEEDGFRYPFRGRDEKLKYSDIERITGYKLDLMATDEICMDIVAGEWKFTFSESLPGWCQLLTRLKAAFPSIPDNWDREIIRPPFATNFTVLFEREDRQIPESSNF